MDLPGMTVPGQESRTFGQIDGQACTTTLKELKSSQSRQQLGSKPGLSALNLTLY
jgi:hypothetical protein